MPALHRALAVVCAALVFALGLFSASPTLHRHLHDAGDAWDHDQCAIVQFANGVSVPVAVTVPLPGICAPRPTETAPAVEICFDSPRYLLRPERGPPAV
jgi:hypothetical protein